MVADLSQDPARLIKLTKSLALHRLLVVLITSNPSYYVIIPCLKILESCLVTSGIDNFLRGFETEGGFALLAKTLSSMWRSDIQALVFRIILGQPGSRSSLLCPPLVSCLMAVLDSLFQSACEGDESGSRPMHGRTRSGTPTSIRSIVLSPVITGTSILSDEII